MPLQPSQPHHDILHRYKKSLHIWNQLADVRAETGKQVGVPQIGMGRFLSLEPDEGEDVGRGLWSR